MLITDSMICSYADDTTIYVSDDGNEEIIRKLESNITTMSDWLWDNCMKLDGEKCLLTIFSNTKDTSLEIKIDNEIIPESSEEKLLRVSLDKTLSFKTHTISLNNSAS